MSITLVPRAHRGPVYAVAAAAEPDGRWRIFTVGSDKLIRSWDADTGAETTFTAPVSSHEVRFLAAADAGGTAMLVYATDSAVARVDRTSGTEIGGVRPPPGVRWTRVRLGAVGLLDDPGLPLVIAGDTQGAIFRWDLRTGEPVGDPLTGHEGAVWSVGATRLADGRAIIVSGGDDATVRRWDAATGDPIGPAMTGHKRPVMDIRFGTGDVLITQTATGSIRRWAAGTGEPIGRPLNQRSVGALAGGLEVTPDGRTLFSVDRARTLSRWDLAADEPVAQPLSGPIAGIAMAGTVLVSTSPVGTVRRWDAAGRETGTPLAGHPTPVYAVAAVPATSGTTGRTTVVASAGQDGARYWEAASGRPVGNHQADPPPAGTGIAGVWLGDGRLIGASGGDGVVWRHDVLAGTWSEHDVRTGEVPTGAVDPLQIADVAATATPDGRGLIAAISAEGAVYRLDAATGHSVGEPLTGHGDEGFAVAATTLPDGTVMIAAAGDDDQIRRWDATTGTPIGAPLKPDDWVMKLDFRALPEGRVLLISTDQNGQVRRWDAVTGTPIGRPLEVGDGPVRTLVPETIDPSNVIAASNDDRTRCWDAITAGHLGDIADSDCGAVAVDSGQTVVAAGHDDGSLEIIRWGN